MSSPAAVRSNTEVSSYTVPPRVHQHMCMFLNHKDLGLRVILVCKDWKALLNDAFWDNFYKQNLNFMFRLTRLPHGIKQPFIKNLDITAVVNQHLWQKGLVCTESRPTDDVIRRGILIKHELSAGLAINCRYTSDERMMDGEDNPDQLKRTATLEFSCELLTPNSGVEQKENKEFAQWSQQIADKVNSHLAKKMEALVEDNLTIYDLRLDSEALESVLFFVGEGTLVPRDSIRTQVPGEAFNTYIPFADRNLRLTKCNRFRTAKQENDYGLKLLALFRDVVSNQTVHRCKANRR